MHGNPNIKKKGICLTFILHIIISIMIKYKPVYEQMSDKKTKQNLILNTFSAFCLNTKNVQNKVHKTGFMIYEMLNSLFKVNHVIKECSQTFLNANKNSVPRPINVFKFV